MVVLAAMVGTYVGVFGSLTWRQQSNFGTFGFDMGIYDQAIWLLSRFKDPFVTVRGLEYFGHHVNPITVLFVPAYWLGAGPHFLYLIETAWMAAGAVPVWLLARDRLASGWGALVLAGAFLLYPSLEWINWWHFHPDALSIAPLLFAWWLASRERWRWYAVAAGIALLCKEDAALALFMLGLIVAWRHHRRIGLATSAIALGWFVLCTRVVIPHANGIGPFYEQFFPGFGTSIGQIFFNAVWHPSRLLHVAWRADRRTYYHQLLGPVGYLPLLGLPASLLGAPQLVVNVISAHPYTHQIRYHYSSVICAAVFVGTIELIGRARRVPALKWGLVGLVGVCSILGNRAWSPSPIGTQYHSGIWAGPSPRLAAVRAALALVPPRAGVAATYYLVPHLTHRVHIYEFPNPWVPTNWGLRGEHPPDPRTVDWFVLDTTLNGDHASLYARLIAPDGDFRVVFQRDNIVVARRK